MTTSICQACVHPFNTAPCRDCMRDPETGECSNWEPKESTDPKKSAGDLKDPLQLLPSCALRDTANVLKLGASKYGEWNWRNSDGVKASTYTGAIMRHLMQFADGEDVDSESNKSHLAHIIATCCILLDANRVGKLIDDRPKVEPNE